MRLSVERVIILLSLCSDGKFFLLALPRRLFLRNSLLRLPVGKHLVEDAFYRLQKINSS